MTTSSDVADACLNRRVEVVASALLAPPLLLLQLPLEITADADAVASFFVSERGGGCCCFASDA